MNDDMSLLTPQLHILVLDSHRVMYPTVNNLNYNVDLHYNIKIWQNMK